MTKREEDLAEDLMQQFEALKSERTTWDTLWQDVAERVLPSRSDIKQTKKSGQDQTSEIFDDVAQLALKIFANGLYGNMASPSIDWFRYGFPDEDLNNRTEIRTWLQKCDVEVYSSLARSNFYLENLPLIKDGAALGTGVMYVGKKDDGSSFYETIHPAQCYIAEDHWGNPDTLFREFRLPVRNVIQKFGYENCPESFRTSYDANRHLEVKIIHAVVPRDDYEQDAILNTKKKFASVWMSSNGEFIQESGFSSFPYLVWRYDKTSPETYGRGPGMSCLATIKSAQLIRRTLLQSAELAVNPALNVPAEMRGRVNIGPRKLNYYDAPDRRIYKVDTGDNYPVGADMMDRVRNDIRDMFDVPFFIALSAAERQGNMTATEVIERQGERASILGPIIVRYTSEVLIPVLRWELENVISSGRVPPPPEIIQDKVYNIEFLGPLAQAQRKFFKSSGITRTLELILPMSQMFPEVLDTINADALAAEIAQTNGMPANTMKSEKAVKELRTQRVKMQQEQMQMQKMAMNAKMISDLGKAGGAGTEEQVSNAMKESMGG